MRKFTLQEVSCLATEREKRVFLVSLATRLSLTSVHPMLSLGSPLCSLRSLVEPARTMANGNGINVAVHVANKQSRIGCWA